MTPQTKTAAEYYEKVIEIWGLLGYDGKEQRRRDPKNRVFHRFARMRADSGFSPAVKRGIDELNRLFARSVQENQGLIVKIAKKLHLSFEGSTRRGTHGNTLDDLKQEGVFAVRRALDLYEPEKNTSFATYLYPWVHHFVSRSMAGGALVHVPIFLQELGSKNLRGLSVTERQRELLTLSRYTQVSLDYKDSPRETGQGGVEILDSSPDPEELVHLRAVRALLNKAATILNARELEIVDAHYSRGVAYQDIAEDLGITRERVRQIEKVALAKMADFLDLEGYDFDSAWY